jgi:WD40 repeat protein
MIFLWDLQTGQALRRLEGHTEMVTRLAFTPDGRHAVSGSRDKSLIVWDLETGQVVHRITGHQAGVNTVAVSPDGRLAASGSGRHIDQEPFSSEDNSVRLWDLESGEEIQRFALFTDSVWDVSFTPDGQQLAVATMSDGFILIDLSTGKALLRPGDWGWLTRVVVSPDGRMALTASDEYRVLMWDLKTGEMLKYLEGVNSGVFGLSISPDGKRALGGSVTTIEWDLDTGEQVRQFIFDANAIAYTPDGRSTLIGSTDMTLRLLALQSGAEIRRLPAGVSHIRGAAYTPDGLTVLTDDTSFLSLWDLRTSNNIWTEPSKRGFWEIAVSPDGKQALTSEQGGSVSLWDVATGKVLKRLESDGSFKGHVDLVYGAAFHPSGKFALTSASAIGNPLIYWDLETAKPVWLFDTNGVLGVAISPDGRTALSAEEGGVVNWWDLEKGELIRRLAGHTNLVWSVAFVDDRMALSASEDSTMILWDLESGTAVRSFLGHSGAIKRVVLSPDKRLALSASRDGTAILWDVQTGQPLRRYTGHTDELMTVAYSPDGGEALSGGRDHQAIRWRIDEDLNSLLDWVSQNRYVHPLTCAEREAFQVEPLCENGTAVAEVDRGNLPATVEGKLIALLPPLPTPELSVAKPLPTTAEVVPAGMATKGVNLGAIPIGGAQVWEYAGNKGENLSIRASASKPADGNWGIDRQREMLLLDTTLTLYAPDGSTLARADDLENGLATDAYLDSITLPQTGIYRIEVGSYQDRTSGSYQLILANPRQLVFTAGLPATAGLAILPNGSTALVGVGQGFPDSLAADDNRIWIWDLLTGEVLRRLEGHQNTPVVISVSPDGRKALSADLDGIIILWNLESGIEMRRFDFRGQALMGILFHPDGQPALTGAIDTTLARWNLTSGEVIQRFEGHEDLVLDLALSPDGRTAYSSSWDNTVRVWDVASAGLIATYQPFADGETNGLAISPDGSRLLVGGGEWFTPRRQAFAYEVPNAVIALLDARTGETLRTLEGHTAVVKSVAFSPDGRSALSGSRDKMVRLWDVNTGKQLAVFTGHTGEVWKVAFSPDGLTGYSTSLDGSFRVWDLSEFIGGSE